MFKIGDKVRIKSAERQSYWYANRIGEVVTLGNYSEDDDDWSAEEGYVATCDIEPISQFDLKKNPWFIRVRGETEFKAAVYWLKSNDIVARYGEDWLSFMGCIRSSGSKFIRADELSISNHKEIKLTYKTLVESVEYPDAETEQDKKIKELKETIDRAQQQLEELMCK